MTIAPPHGVVRAVLGELLQGGGQQRHLAVVAAVAVRLLALGGVAVAVPVPAPVIPGQSTDLALAACPTLFVKTSATGG
ncbi:hypothetical protein ABT300_21155 [Streptomyces sp. NPDC001027]|uniref:hypothetical protein n=1 Tax=Streptomyces sp. NPDC001027 TaxID=3154771 RepID=UPI003320B9D6